MKSYCIPRLSSSKVTSSGTVSNSKQILQPFLSLLCHSLHLLLSLLLEHELLTGRAGRFLQPLNPFRPFIAPHAPSSTHQNCHEYWCCVMSSPHATASGMPCPVCHHCRGHRRCSVSSGCMDEGPQSQHVPGLAEVLSKHLPKR